MTQNQTILNHLKTRKRGITAWGAIEKYHITRLAGRILELKEKGVKIGYTWEMDGKTKWKRYFLVA